MAAMLHKLASLLVASPLAVIGVIGLTSSHHGRAVSAAAAADPTDQPSALALSNLLAEREITLEHRREAQQLVNDFTLGQMTRHYWGAFASSLKDLGLSAGEHVVTHTESNDQITTLWVIPPRGAEAFLAVVERREGRLIAWSCRGAKGAIPQEPGATCPSGWVQIDRTEDF